MYQHLEPSDDALSVSAVSASYRYSGLINHLSPKCKEFVICRLEDGWSLKSISAMCGLSDVECRSIAKEKKVLEKAKKRQIRLSKLPYKITENHVAAARDYLYQNSHKKITIRNLQRHLEGMEELKRLSRAGVYYLLTKVLRFSYKKAHSLPK